MALEQFSKTVTLNADASEVWQDLTDVRVLADWVQIVHSVSELERLKSYTAVLEDHVGPFHLRADLAISVRVGVEGEQVHVDASGRDRAVNSRIEIHGDLTLARQAVGCSVALEGSYQVTGKVAAMGAGVVRKKAERALEDFTANLSRAFGGEAAPQPAQEGGSGLPGAQR